MPICRDCGNVFPNWVEITGKKRNLSSRKYCLSCLPFKARTRRGVIKLVERQFECVCRKCGREYVYDRDNKRGHGIDLCNSCRVNARRCVMKQRAVDYKGGECVVCGYSRCLRAIGFHHVDPEEKKFSMSSSTHMASWGTLRMELDKCVLVCANCHAEIEDGMIKSPGVSPRPDKA